MYTDYQTFNELGTAPDYLWIGASAIHNLRATRAQASAFRAEHDPQPEDDQPPARKHGRHARTYKSVYVGVTTHNNRYVAPGSGGKVHPKTPEGERWAAQDRARALERDYLERRDGNHEPL